jgi:hypothetical protein
MSGKQCCGNCKFASLGNRSPDMSFRDCTAPLPYWADWLIDSRVDRQAERLVDVISGEDCAAYTPRESEAENGK